MTTMVTSVEMLNTAIQKQMVQTEVTDEKVREVAYSINGSIYKVRVIQYRERPPTYQPHNFKPDGSFELKVHYKPNMSVEVTAPRVGDVGLKVLWWAVELGRRVNEILTLQFSIPVLKDHVVWENTGKMTGILPNFYIVPEKYK